MFIGIASKLIIGFFALMIVMRAIGKKALSEITPFDIIYSFVLGGIVEESIYDDQIHALHMLFAFLVWGVIIYIVESLLQRRDSLTRKMKGRSSVLIFNGELNMKEIKDNHIEMEQLRSMLRTQNCFSLKEVQYAVMEINGQVSVMKKDEQHPIFSYLLIDEGVVEKKTLISIGKDIKWLYEEIAKLNHLSTEDIVYAEWSNEEGFYIKTYEDSIEEQYEIDG
ncbi:MAG TPA: DUF421 domain-containing protein [Candidatus Jeotgalibaca pullicola]|nr:DUF421 domain-containing protein [Candidatus Jeotgalibaca pullicola]